MYPTAQTPQAGGQPDETKKAQSILTFPYPDSKPRLDRYSYNDQLFWGAHFDAFRQMVQSNELNKAFQQLKYVTGNFAGLVSKVCADMLFSEPIKVGTDDESSSEFLEGLIFQNKLHTQNYESALSNSRHGDALYKIRSGFLNPGDEQMTVIIEDITPSIYFPQLNSNNTRSEPDSKELAWILRIGSKDYLRKETHYPGYILNELYLIEKDKIRQQVTLDILGDPDLQEVVDTNVSKSLLVHIPNWRDGSRYFGYDDYGDLISLFYALNNRMTKTENILDKHSDPILALPEGVLDEDGNVKKEAFHMFEIPSEGAGSPIKPEYIVWNANLEANFKQVDKIVELMYMFSETSPDAFGMGDGKVDSGRALKLRLMRTIAKVARKRLYYDAALKEVLHTAQLFAVSNDLGVYNEKTDDYSLRLGGAPQIPDIEWQDGLPLDQREAVEIEQIRLASENTTLEDSIMRLDGVDEAAAKEKADEIRSANGLNLPSSNPKLDGEEDDPGDEEELEDSGAADNGVE